MVPKLDMTICRRRLAALWFAGGLLLFLLVATQTVLNRYGERVEEAWAWLLPAILPTLSLILGVLIAEQVATGPMRRLVVDRFFYRLASGLSAVYLLLVAATILLSPFSTSPLLEVMRRSNLYLGPLQGLVAAALGVFFVKAVPAGGGRE